MPGNARSGAVPSPAVTSEDKRQRHKDGHRSRMEAAREAQARADRRRLLTMGAVAVLAVVLIVAAIMLTGGDDGDEAAGSTTTSLDTSSTDSTVPGAATTVSLPAPPEGSALDGETECPPADGAEERVATFTDAPPTCIEGGEDLVADVVTSAGSFTIDLDEEGAPTMVNNFVVLARYRFFDGLPFHRLIPGFMAQTGSSGSPDYGSGGPGYDMPDEEKPAAEGFTYTAGDVAMARSDTVSGSQFFIVATDEGAAHLTPDYPLFGKVTEGQDVVEAIAAQGDPATNGAPTALVTVDSVTIRAA